jgi:hypothetical protein
MNTDGVKFWDLLTEDDKHVLTGLRAALSAPSLKNKRNTRVADLAEILDTLKIFQFHSEEDVWKRCLVTGFVELAEGLAINAQQLHTLIFKCRSSINGSLRRMGYSAKVTAASAFDQLFEKIPLLKTNPAELRQWTIRKKGEHEPTCEEPDASYKAASSESDHCGELPEFSYDPLFI